MEYTYLRNTKKYFTNTVILTYDYKFDYRNIDSFEL